MLHNIVKPHALTLQAREIIHPRVKKISLKYYPNDEGIRITVLEQVLERLIIKFELAVVESYANRDELLEFVGTFWHKYENKSLYKV